LWIAGVDREKQVVDQIYMRAWEPDPITRKIDLVDVENTCYAMHQRYGFEWLGCDPYQGELMAQRLQAKGVPIEMMRFDVPSNLTKMAESFVHLVKNGKLRCFDDEEGRLRRDFGKFHLVEKTYGLKLEATADEFGHADVGTALVIAMPKALELLRTGGRLMPDDDIACDDDSPLTRKEIEAMPKELREIYEMGPEEETDRRSIEPKRTRAYDSKRMKPNDSEIPDWDFDDK